MKTNQNPKTTTPNSFPAKHGNLVSAERRHFAGLARPNSFLAKQANTVSTERRHFAGLVRPNSSTEKQANLVSAPPRGRIRVAYKPSRPWHWWLAQAYKLIPHPAALEAGDTA